MGFRTVTVRSHEYSCVVKMALTVRAGRFPGRFKEGWPPLWDTMLKLIELTSEAVAVTGLHEFSDRAEEIRQLIDEELSTGHCRERRWGMLSNWSATLAAPGAPSQRRCSAGPWPPPAAAMRAWIPAKLLSLGLEEYQAPCQASSTL